MRVEHEMVVLEHLNSARFAIHLRLSKCFPPSSMASQLRLPSMPEVYSNGYFPLTVPICFFFQESSIVTHRGLSRNFQP